MTFCPWVEQMNLNVNFQLSEHQTDVVVFLFFLWSREENLGVDYKNV